MGKNLTRKIVSVSLSVTTAVWLSGAAMLVPVVSAQSTADLQAQIAALLAQITALQAQLNAASGGAAAPAYNFAKDLTLGSKGADVKALQQWLNASGYPVAASGAGSAGNETEYFGNATKAALAKYQAAKGISPAVGYFGPKTRASVAAAGGAPSVPGQPPVVAVPGSGLALSLASDNPRAQTMAKGASGMVFLKFNVVGSGTIDSLTFKRAGVGATADFSSNGIYLYDGSARLASGKTLNSTTHQVTFVNLALAVSGVKTLSLLADVSTNSTTGNVNRFELVSVTGSPTPSGSLVGADMQISGATVGGLVVTTTTAPTAPKLGQVGAKLSEFKLTASSTEDVLVKRLSLTEGGSIANANLSNFSLKQGGSVVASVASVGAKDLINLVFATPFKIEKGQERTFELYGDVSGGGRTTDTIIIYFDSKSDVEATGLTYGYPIAPDITGMDTTAEVSTLTVAGGPVTIVFNGPVASDLSRRGQDVTLFDFTIASQNNIEIKNLPLRVTSTFGAGQSDEGFNDFKVWDVGSGALITSAVDITATSTNQTFTDVIQFSAGQTRRFKVTADIDADLDAADSVRVTLRQFTLGDIKNLDNNANVALADIVPNSDIFGNTLSVVAPTLTLGLSASPSSQTYVQGVSDKALVGFSFRATGGDARLDTVRVTASAQTGSLTAGEITSLALYDGATKVSEVKSLDTSALTASFTGLNLTIPSGATKLLTLRGDVSTNAGTNDVYFFYMDSNTASDVTAYDKDGNTVTYAGDNGPNEAGSGSTRITVTNVGNVNVAAAGTDSETQADIVVAKGTEQTLAKFIFSATNENMTVEKLAIMVNATSTNTGTSTATGDEVPWVKLYDGSTLIGGPYYPEIGSTNNSSSIAQIASLNWVIPKDTNKTLTVKGLVNTVGDGADTGANVFVHVLSTGFKANGVSSQDYAIDGASGNRKVVYKSRPKISAVSPQYATGDNTLSTTPTIKALRFRVEADANNAISWRQAQFQVTLTNATMAAGSTTNVTLTKISTGSSLALSTVLSGTGVASTTSAAVRADENGGTGYVGIVLTTPENIGAGSSQDYDLALTMSQLVGATAHDSQAVVRLYRQETTPVGSTWYIGIATVVDTAGTSEIDADMSPSFIWSDQSVLGTFNATTTADWANGVYVQPLSFTDVMNTLRD